MVRVCHTFPSVSVHFQADILRQIKKHFSCSPPPVCSDTPNYRVLNAGHPHPVLIRNHGNHGNPPPTRVCGASLLVHQCTTRIPSTLCAVAVYAPRPYLSCTLQQLSGLMQCASIRDLAGLEAAFEGCWVRTTSVSGSEYKLSRQGTSIMYLHRASRTEHITQHTMHAGHGTSVIVCDKRIGTVDLASGSNVNFCHSGKSVLTIKQCIHMCFRAHASGLTLWSND